MNVSNPQPLNAASGSLVTLAGICISVSEEHPPKHHAERLDSEVGRLISVSEEQYANDPQPILVRVSGNTTFFK